MTADKTPSAGPGRLPARAGDAAATYPIQVTSTVGEALNVYTTMSQAPTNPPSSDPADYVPTYTLLGTVPANGVGNFTTDEPIARVVVTRQANEQPVKVSVADALTPGSGSISVAPADLTVAQAGWTFYQNFSSQPFSPVALEFSALVENTPVAGLVDAAAAFFSQNDASGVTMGLFTAIGYWASNQLYAFPGTYYCYEPPPASSMGFILPKTQVGTLTIADGKATYVAVSGDSTDLTFANNKLTGPGATASNGVVLNAIIRDLTWEGQPDIITWGFVGTLDGQQFIAQSYEEPQLPWYSVLYDLAYGAFFTIQVVMAVDAAIHLLTSIPGGLKWLADNVGKLADKVRGALNSAGDSAAPDTAVGDAADPINVDIDIDVDVDVDVDVDIDIDVDVEVDVDVDVDVDFIAVVDVDVDVDVDIDIDVVTENDIDIDIDIDIDTDVDVQPGAISKLLNSVGNWIMTKALPFLIEGVTIYVAFQSVGALLEAWKQKDEEAFENLQPRQTTGLGLLVNYMLNDGIPVATRWTTFSQYVQEVNGDSMTLQVALASIVQTKNSQADTEMNNWRWSDDDKAAVVAQMAPNTGANAYLAFQTLANATFQGQPLPVKVGVTVAMAYLKA
ncbi:hypothetical protein [Nannocystis punicea]|uniref:Uncharacterized protein n=1 Tax=Nannocystis punicea TaxID=2995304 RepID=A0ABY7GW25_9BACT|nr:hypothetical protein [Nannocystis poenicansa]WAS91141.1 hypothetical protein O0S08_33560 [Nannocystis poenicansa]